MQSEQQAAIEPKTHAERSDTNELLRQSRQVLYNMGTLSKADFEHFESMGNLQSDNSRPHVTPQTTNLPFDPVHEYNEPNEQCYGSTFQAQTLDKQPPWVKFIISSLDGRLKSIESQITDLNTKWKYIDDRLQNQNSRFSNMEQHEKQIHVLKHTTS